MSFSLRVTVAPALGFSARFSTDGLVRNCVLDNNSIRSSDFSLAAFVVDVGIGYFLRGEYYTAWSQARSLLVHVGLLLHRAACTEHVVPSAGELRPPPPIRCPHVLRYASTDS